MSLMGMIRSFMFNLWKARWRFLLTILSAVIFTLLIFPFSDLTDLLSSQVSQNTQNNVYLQADGLDLSFFPQPGLRMDDVFVEASTMPGLSIKQLTVTPSVMALLSRKIQGHANAQGLFKGEVDIQLYGGGTTEKGADLHRLELRAERLNLQELRQTARLPMLLKGHLNIEAKGTADATFGVQPEMDVVIKVDHLEIPPTSVPVPNMGELQLPELKLSQVEIRGKLSDGRLTVESAQLGKQGDDLSATIKGNMILNLRNNGAGVQPEIGAYNFEISLQPSADFQRRASFFISLLSDMARQTNPAQMKFKVSGSGMYASPRFESLR